MIRGLQVKVGGDGGGYNRDSGEQRNDVGCVESEGGEGWVPGDATGLECF